MNWLGSIAGWRGAERSRRVYNSPVTGDRTESIASDARPRSHLEWALIVALDCQALTAWPESFGLGGLTEVSIGRGAERRFAPTGARSRLDLPDRWISQNHARLLRTGDRWTFEDEGSRNGSRVNGERVERTTLGDGDVLECGGTYLVLRRSDGSTAQLGPLAQRPEALRTLSPALDHELVVLRKVARSPIPVLVLGESGTGKEGMANVIHALSGRDGPMLAVNCGAIPATLVESELFGSRRGAFSGAEERPGLIRSAERGTLFLDEVAELPVSSQSALLRVLQEKQLLPLGANRPIPVDVRVVAATNRPVAELVQDGKLRHDLYARLRGYELRLPPLRERREDLGLLVTALIARHGGTGARRTLSRTAAWALFAYSWPLNIRELEQCLSAAVTVAGAEIGVEHLPQPVREAGSSPRPASTYDRERLVAILQRHRGNLSAVARELATSRTQLYRLLTRHSIRREEMKPTPTPRAP
jgi:Sigma-54 interaction domain/FHA domain/Bacterial regulatory protein, Fis family